MFYVWITLDYYRCCLYRAMSRSKSTEPRLTPACGRPERISTSDSESFPPHNNYHNLLYYTLFSYIYFILYYPPWRKGGSQVRRSSPRRSSLGGSLGGINTFASFFATFEEIMCRSQVVLDKLFPLRIGRELPRPLAPAPLFEESAPWLSNGHNANVVVVLKWSQRSWATVTPVTDDKISN